MAVVSPAGSVSEIEDFAISRLIRSGQTVVSISPGGDEWLEAVVSRHAAIRALVYAGPGSKPAAISSCGTAPPAVHHFSGQAEAFDLDDDTLRQDVPQIHYLRIGSTRPVRRILKGAARLISRSCIGVLQFPLDTFDLWTAQTVNELLICSGYVMFEVCLEGEQTVRLRRYALHDLERKQKVAQVVAVHERMLPIVSCACAGAMQSVDPLEAIARNNHSLGGLIQATATDGEGEKALEKLLGISTTAGGKLNLRRSLQDAIDKRQHGIVHSVKADVKTFWGDRMTVTLPEEVSFLIAVTRLYEKELTRILIEYLDEGMVFFDVGAHYGYFTLLASTIVGDGGQVHSFEPTKDTYELLVVNAAGRKNIKLNNKAVYSATTELSFQNFGVDHCAYNSLFAPRVIPEEAGILRPETTRVSAVSIDDYVCETGVIPNFIKVDAESSEYQILEGMRHTIARHRPIFTVEVGDKDIKGVRPSRELVNHAISFGYRVLSCSDGAILPHAVQDRYSYDNLLFLPEECEV